MPGRRDFRGGCVPFQNGREDFRHNFHEKRVVVYPPRVEISPGITGMDSLITANARQELLSVRDKTSARSGAVFGQTEGFQATYN